MRNASFPIREKVPRPYEECRPGRRFHALMRNVSFPTREKVPHPYEECFVPDQGEGLTPLRGMLRSRSGRRSHTLTRNALFSIREKVPHPYEECFVPDQGEGPTPLRGMLRSSLKPMWDLTIHLPPSPGSSPAHRSVSSSNTICNSPNPPNYSLKKDVCV